MKRCAALTAKLTRRKAKNSTNHKHFISFALALLICGLFYSLFVNPKEAAKAKDSSAATDIICEQDIPRATLADPTFELYKLEELCNKPERQDIQQLTPPLDPAIMELQEELENILDGTPMEDMIESIAQQDRTIAAFLVGIAFKESKFGVYSPKNNGADCYNYWGFKGKTNPVAGGYSCFSSPEEAVQKVGERLEKLVLHNKLNTPAKMTVWKCGSSCATHTPGSVAKWISDVSIHFYTINKS